MDLALIELSDSEEEVALPTPRSTRQSALESGEPEEEAEYQLCVDDSEYPDTWSELNAHLHELNDNLYFLNEQVERIKPPRRSRPSKKQRKKQRQKKKLQQQMQQTPDIKRIVIYSEERKKADSRLIDFIDFCCREELFSDQYLDLENRFSIFETQLPETFEMMAQHNKISQTHFIKFFQERGYFGDLLFIFSQIDRRQKKKIDWDDFADFFFPYIRKISMKG